MITQYLSELLYEHNCVILPGFGGFIGNRIQSKVNEMQQRVEPARKVVAFNINLTQNDGLLASYIAKSKAISFDEANLQITEFVEELKTGIQLKRHAILKGIGDLYLNTEDKIVFVPEADINFAKETYGLFPITIRKILRDNENEKIVEKEKLREKPLRLERPKIKRSRKWIYSTVFIALPLAVGLFTQQTGILQKADFNIGNMFKQPTPVLVVKEPVKEPLKEEAKVVEQPKPAENKTEEAVNITPPAVTKEVTKIEQPAAVNTTVSSATFHFHVIGGSFAVPTNAQNFVKQLQSKGYKAYIAGTNASGLEMVSYDGFATETEAVQFLQKIHQTENAQAWLLNN